jgi:GWxTD domain-containing protein
MFIEQFWRRRDPTPPTVANEFRESYYQRLAEANDRFAWGAVPGWATDRALIYIRYGAPVHVTTHPGRGLVERPAAEGGGTALAVPFERWEYARVEGVGQGVVFEFVDPEQTGEYHLAQSPSDKYLSAAN